MALISLKPFAQRRHVGHQDRMLRAAPVSAELSAMPNDQVRALGQRIREARYKAKLTLEKIGNHFGTAKQTVQQWETGQVLLN